MSTENFELIADTCNTYLEEYNRLLKKLKECESMLMNDLFKFRGTERDEVNISLTETKRKALTQVRIEDGEFKLNLQSILQTKEDTEKVSEVVNEIKVIDPIKLIHGGFTSSSIKNTSREYRNLIIQIIKIVNLKNKINTELNRIETK